MSIEKPPVPLNRSFSRVRNQKDESGEQNWEEFLGLEKPTQWADLDSEYRCVILAEAGAGKTHEMLNRAKHSRAQGKTAFFIRIENIESDFEDEFEVGTEDDFEQWLESDEEAWFYLDSVDEARLASSKAFEKAIKCFSRSIRSALQRAHIILSSRPYAWRTASDRKLLEEKLPHAQQTNPPEQAPLAEPRNQQSGAEDEDVLKVYYLNALSNKDIRFFAEHRNTEELEQFMNSLQRSNLTSMAERPFDLDVILDKWRSDKELGQRLEMLQHSIQRQLKEIDTDRAESQPLHLDTALKGARLIAATVALTGEPGIKVPGSQAPDGIEASELLGPEWPNRDVRALLERGIFNDVLYGHVRFRHREIRDLLAAEWFHDQLKNGASRRKIENLFFAEQYGEKVIRPRLRSVLVWLVILDADIRQRAVSISPEIITEGGDPACLPFIERKQILKHIVQRIAAEESTPNSQDYAAIARIALMDLADITLELIEQYKNNDDAIWFLGRLVWQGQMTQCLPPLKKIALNPVMNQYSRRVCVRSVTALGTEQEGETLWEQLNQLPEALDPQVLTELTETCPCNAKSVELLLESIEKLPPHSQYDSGFSGLKFSLHNMLDRFSESFACLESEALFHLISGINRFLEREPHIEKRDCSVSEEYKWLIPTASHSIEKLISVRSPYALKTECLSALSQIPDVDNWIGMDENKYQETLEELVPKWHDLNDALFWFRIDQIRKTSDKPVTDHWHFGLHRQFAQFGEKRFSDVLDYVKSKEHMDDKLVALSLAFDIFNKSKNWLEALQEATSGTLELENLLSELLIEENARKQKAEEIALKHENLKREESARKLKEEHQYTKWIEDLRANPKQLENLPNDIEALTNNHIWLMRKVDEPNNYINKESLHNWKGLTPKFGEQVAETYRKIAIQQWRRITPELRSEGGNTISWTYALMLAFAGLEIEFRETENFVQNLSEKDAEHLLRYWFWGLDRLQTRMEPVYQKYPGLVFESVWTELQWELENTPTEKSQHYVLGYLESHVPWLNEDLANSLFKWLERNEPENPKILKKCLNITLSAGIEASVYLNLIQTKTSKPSPDEITAIWYALWLLLEADTGLPAIDKYLASIAKQEAIQQAQLIIDDMFEFRFSAGFENIHKAQQLKQLYLLTYEYSPPRNDIANNYQNNFPIMGRNTEDTKNGLLNQLSNTPGQDAYIALTELSNEHPIPSSRTRMRSLAYKRAEQDSELDLMSANQVREFADHNSITPTSHKQLFNLTVDQLLDLKDWLEQGNDSPYKVWKEAEKETEVRNLFAGQLNKMAMGRYNCIQENELANAQRPDIWMTSIHLKSPVPIELKVLDKDWSGTKLCERLRNQLAGDYLREEEARCGVFLLVWQGEKNRSYWEIEGKRVKLPELQSALTKYWNSISGNYPGIDNLEILVIDLTIREHKADS